MFEWFLLHVVTPLLIPVCMLMFFTALAGGRADAVISVLGSFLVTLARIVGDLLKIVLVGSGQLLFDLIKSWSRKPPRVPPRPAPRNPERAGRASLDDEIIDVELVG